MSQRQKRRQQERKRAKTGRRYRESLSWRPYALCASAAALAVFAYRGALANPFVYDDRLTVVGNPSIRDLGQPLTILLHDIFRPVVNFSYAIDFARFGLEPSGYHITNILLHAVNVALLFVVALVVFRDVEKRFEPAQTQSIVVEVSAFATASIFAVHPVMTEAVGYISGRSELLCTTFFLSGFLALRRFLANRSRKWLVAGLAAFALGLGSKETAAMLPFALMAYDALILGGTPDRKRRRFIRFHLPFATLIILAGLVRVGVFLGVERGSEAIGIWQNALTEAGVIWRYLMLLAVPVSQSILHPVETVTGIGDPRAVLAVVALVGVLAALWFARRRFPLVVLGSVWFLLLLAPAHVLPLQEAMAEHRVYTASCGLFLATGAVLRLLLYRVQQKNGAVHVIAGAILVPLLAVLLIATSARNRIWADPISLWGDAAAKAPSTWGAHYAHADALRAAGRCEEAVAAYQRAIDLIPEQAPAHLNRGICLAQLERYDEAAAAFTTVTELDPSNPQPHNNLGTLAARLGRLEEARDHFLEAIRLDPRNIRARLSLAQMNESVFDNPGRALELCLEVLQFEPGAAAAKACAERNRARLR